ALGEVADIGQGGGIRGAGDCRRHFRSVLRQQQLGQRADRAGRLAAGRLGRPSLRRAGRVVRGLFGRSLPRLRGIEKQIEAVAHRLLLVLGLGERQQQGIAQDPAVGKTDVGDGAHRIDALGRREPDSRSPRRAKEAMQVLAHRTQPKTLWWDALATKLVTCGSVASMSASYFNSTLRVSLTISWPSSAACSSTSTRAQSMVSLTDGSFLRSRVRTSWMNPTICLRSNCEIPGTRLSTMRSSSFCSGKPM